MAVYQSVSGVPGAGIEPARLFRARDFKSLVELGYSLEMQK